MCYTLYVLFQQGVVAATESHDVPNPPDPEVKDLKNHTSVAEEPTEQPEPEIDTQAPCSADAEEDVTTQSTPRGN